MGWPNNYRNSWGERGFLFYPARLPRMPSQNCNAFWMLQLPCGQPGCPKDRQGTNGTYSSGRQTLIIVSSLLAQMVTGPPPSPPCPLTMLKDDNSKTVLVSFHQLLTVPASSGGTRLFGGRCAPKGGSRVERLRNPTSTIFHPSDTLPNKCLQHSTQSSESNV